MNSVVLSDRLIQCHFVFPSRLGCLLVLLVVYVRLFGCVVSRSVEGAALGLHGCFGVHSCSFDFAGGVSFAYCGCELCLVGVVFVVTRCVGVPLLRNLASPVRHHLQVFSVVLVWKVSWLVVVLALSMMGSRQSSSCFCGVGLGWRSHHQDPVVSVSTKDSP